MGDVHERVVTGALRCIARWGVAKTTLDDIAREAGCSRATIYRTFPGGKNAVMLATGEAEVQRLLVDLAIALDATETLEDLLVVAMVESIRAIRAHEALQYLTVHEPEHLLVHVSFDALDPLLALATDFGAPYLERHVDARAAARRGRVDRSPHRLVGDRPVPDRLRRSRRRPPRSWPPTSCPVSPPHL